MSTAPPLAVPPVADADGLLEAFLAWVEAQDLSLYPAQEEAILEIFDGRHVLLNTPTGSGKSLVAVAAHFRSLARGERSFYTSPIKALVSEKFFSLCRTFGAEHVGMLTGDGAINADAAIVCCTAEVLSNMALLHGADTDVRAVVMDEFHYFSDRDRGTAWQVPLLLLSRATFLLMSATLGDTRAVTEQLEQLTGVEVATVSSDQRPVPLDFVYADSPMLETLATLIEQERAPVYLVNFSQREAAELAQSLCSSPLASKEQRGRIRAEIGGFRFDSAYGKKLKTYLQHGVGVHHAGLLPKYRLLVERLAQKGLLAVICGTDTLGVGVNVPIRSVLFTRLYKYDGQRSRVLSVRDFHQIAGRAGRKGYDSRGYVHCQAPAHVIETARLQRKVASGLLPKKKFRREPPPKGYVHYDEAAFLRLVEGEPEALASSFRVDHGMLLSLLHRDPRRCGVDGGYGALLDLIDASLESPQSRAKLKDEARRLLDGLIEAEIVVEDVEGEGLDGPLRLADDLQEQFSLYQNLSMFLIHALSSLDPSDEDYAVRVISLVECIQESPRPILYAQRSRAKGEKIAELKAEGMDYHERMEALEEVSWPKPDEDWIYDQFNEYIDGRPWLQSEHVRPKSIARELVQSWMSFHEYVRELRLERVEGLLLRYLSQTYKVLLRSVPEALHSDELEEAIAHLRATVTQADSSLITEWEKLLEGGEQPAELPSAPRAIDISLQPKAFQARIRAELHRLVRALAHRRFEEAPSCVRGGPDAWDARAFEQVMVPYFAEHQRLRFDHEARLSEHTIMRKLAPHRWELTQRLLDPEGEGFWMIEGLIDLREDSNPEGPLVELVRIGE